MGGKNILTYLRYKSVSCRPGCDGSKPDRRSCDGSKPLPVASLGPRRAGCRRPPPSPARLRTATAMPSPVATADTVAAAAVAHNYRRRASTCCLQHLAAPPAAVAFIWMPLPPSCVPLWPSPLAAAFGMLLAVPCSSNARWVQLLVVLVARSCMVVCTEAALERMDAWHLPLFAASLGRVR